MLDVLHGIYERLIHWIFSAPPLPRPRAAVPAYGRPFDADRRSATRARRDAGASPRSRRAAIVLLVGVASFVGAIAIAPLVGTEFIPESDDSYIRMNVTLPVGTSLTRGSEKLRAGRGRWCARCPRSA